MDRFERVVNRFLDIMDQMDKMYINILEEAVIGEAEVLERGCSDPSDTLKLIGYRALKEIALGELGYLSGEGDFEFLDQMVVDTPNVLIEDSD